MYAALASHLLNWWLRHQLQPAGQPLVGLRQLIGRIISLPARLLRTTKGQLLLLLPPTHPDARCLARAAPGWQLPLPFPQLSPCDAHL